MLRKLSYSEIRLVQVICTLGFVFLISTFLITANIYIASAAAPEPSTEIYLPSKLQSTATPTPTLQIESTTVYSFSVANLGYGERTLSSPYDTTQYVFRVPDNWAFETDGMFELELSYFYNQFQVEEYPTYFGNLIVMLNNQTLEIFPINEEFDQQRLQIPLPASLLNEGQTRHVIELTLDGELLCMVPHKASLTINPSSSITLNYIQRPLVLSLDRYPWPFYQRAFETDKVGIVLPSSPTANDLTNALAVSAKLGDLTNNQLVISDTSKLDLDQSLGTTDLDNQHLIAIGHPQANPLIAHLNDIVDLPVSFHQQQTALTVKGPGEVTPGEVITYTFVITNTIDQPVTLSTVVSLSPYGKFAGCQPNCIANDQNNSITWDSGESLLPDKTLNFSLTLTASEVLTTATIENAVTINEASLGPIGGNTFTTNIIPNDSVTSELQLYQTENGDYFFVYNNQVVAKDDGIIQEIISPWNQNRAILILTGLNNKAVEKASQAMSSETRFPGMSGPVALVQETLFSAELDQSEAVIVEKTFEEMGYPDQIIRGVSQQTANFEFFVPLGWQLTDEAFIDLYFSHSQLIDYNSSGVTVLLNNTPIASKSLDNSTSGDGSLRISLGGVNIRTGQTNRLAIQADMSFSREKCTTKQAEQAWFLIKNSSKLSLSHSESGVDFNLSHYPYPFHVNTALKDLLFILPDASTNLEREAAFRLAAALGASARGKTILPTAITANSFSSQPLEEYHMIAIGRPSRNALIQEVNDMLPQPFLSGTDKIEQTLDNVILRLSSGVELGYIQLMPSLWNTKRAFLVVTGTSDKSFYQAADLVASRPWALKNGNLTLIKADEVDTIDTRRLTNNGTASAIATIVPEMTPAVDATHSSTPTASLQETPPIELASDTQEDTATTNPVQENQVSEEKIFPAWLIPVVGVNSLIVVIIFAVAYWQGRRKTS